MQASMKAYVNRLCDESEKDDLIVQVERLPAHLIIRASMEMCGHKNLVWLQRKLFNKPRIISSILQNRKHNQVRLVVSAMITVVGAVR